MRIQTGVPDIDFQEPQCLLHLLEQTPLGWIRLQLFQLPVCFVRKAQLALRRSVLVGVGGE